MKRETASILVRTAVVAGAVMSLAHGQLNQNCTVSILNRTAQVDANGKRHSIRDHFGEWHSYIQPGSGGRSVDFCDESRHKPESVR